MTRCLECEAPITGVPVVSLDQVGWLGYERADKWCSASCRDTAGESREQQLHG